MRNETNFNVVGEIITSIGNTAVGFYSAKKQAELNTLLSTQSAQEQKRINEQLVKAKTESDKIKLLDYLKEKAERRKYIPYYIGGGIFAVVVIIGIVLLTKKK